MERCPICSEPLEPKHDRVESVNGIPVWRCPSWSEFVVDKTIDLLICDPVTILP